MDSIEAMQLRDPLFRDKQYLVTMIYNSFVSEGVPIDTSSEFYRIGDRLSKK